MRYIKRIPNIFLILLTLILLIFIFQIAKPKSKEKIHNILKMWPPDRNRNISNYIFKNQKLEVRLAPNQFCKEDRFLVIVIMSSPQNSQQRYAIRKTFGSLQEVAKEKIGIYFILGLTLASKTMNDVITESEKYNDIIQGNFLDHYYNLTLKVTFSMGFIQEHCRDNVRFVMKTDDDIYLNLPLLVKNLKTNYSQNDVLTGHRYIKARRYKDPSEKWYIPDYMYAGDVFPPYLSGSGYVMSIDVVEKLFRSSLNEPLFHLEDIYLTGICARRAKVNPQNDDKFFYRSGKNYNICHMKKYYNAHRFFDEFTSNDFYSIHKDLDIISKRGQCEEGYFEILKWINIFKKL